MKMSNDNTYKIAVIVTAYNAEKYIDRCLTSLMEQSLIEVQCVIIDDGSTDQTLKIINEIITKYPKKTMDIKVVSRENKGVSFSRSEGLSYINSEYFIFLDSDDWIERNALKYLYLKAESNNADMVIADYFIYRNGVSKDSCSPEISGVYNIISQMLLGNIKGFSWNKLIKTSILKDNEIDFVSGIDYLEDFLYSLKLISKSKRIFYLSRAIIYYNQDSEHAITRRLDEKKIRDILSAINHIELYLYEINMYHNLQPFLYNFKMHHKYNLLYQSRNKKYLSLFDGDSGSVFKTNLSINKKIILYLSSKSVCKLFVMIGFKFVDILKLIRGKL